MSLQGRRRKHKSTIGRSWSCPCRAPEPGRACRHHEGDGLQTHAHEASLAAAPAMCWPCRSIPPWSSGKGRCLPARKSRTVDKAAGDRSIWRPEHGRRGRAPACRARWAETVSRCVSACKNWTPIWGQFWVPIDTDNPRAESLSAQEALGESRVSDAESCIDRSGPRDAGHVIQSVVALVQKTRCPEI